MALHSKVINHKVALLNDYSNLPPITGTLGDKPIVISGSTNQIGISLIRHLLAVNKDLIALYFTQALPFAKSNIKWMHADFASEHLVLDHIPSVDCLIHTAGLWLLPDHIKQLARIGIKRLICFSSTSIYGKSDSHNNKEQAIVKILEEAEDSIIHQCEQLDIRWTILRPTLIYGLGLDKNISTIVSLVRKLGFFPIFPPASGLRQPVHADDLAIAALNTIHNPACYNQAYNLPGGETLSYKEMVERIFEAHHIKPRFIKTSSLPFLLNIFNKFRPHSGINSEMAYRMNKDLTYDFKTAKHDFGYNPRMFLKHDSNTHFGIE